MPSSPASLRPEDLDQLERRGIAPEEAQRQLELLREPPRPLRLARACTVGDGIHQLDDADGGRRLEAWREASEARRITKFVPASGAATRMFRELMEGEPEAVRRLFAERRSFSFGERLEAAIRRTGRDTDRAADWAGALLDPAGLGYAALPKGLLSFHTYPDGSRTAFEEHLVEAGGLAGTAGRAHFTVSPEHMGAFRGALERSSDLAGSLEVDFSTQRPATDTLAIDLQGRPFRTSAGELLLRPSGHGALLDNLQRLDGDLVTIKNIDNIQPEWRQAEVVSWKRHLIGEAVLRSRELTTAATLPMSEAVPRVAAALDLDAPRTGDLERWVHDRLSRPLRLCGMVRNEGEPGGGPFWVRHADGSESRQIVESSQIDHGDSDQAAIVAGSTHFNPVDLVCVLRRPDGTAFDLEAFVDPTTAFVSRKSHEGRALLGLERPGLWNGAMARWNTLFVEVPAATFAPVKTVFDLLRPEHQPAGR